MDWLFDDPANPAQISDETRDLAPVDRLMIPQGTPHRVDNPHAEPALLTIVYSAAIRNYAAC